MSAPRPSPTGSVAATYCYYQVDKLRSSLVGVACLTAGGLVHVRARPRPNLEVLKELTLLEVWVVKMSCKRGLVFIS